MSVAEEKQRMQATYTAPLATASECCSLLGLSIGGSCWQPIAWREAGYQSKSLLVMSDPVMLPNRMVLIHTYFAGRIFVSLSGSATVNGTERKNASVLVAAWFVAWVGVGRTGENTESIARAVVSWPSTGLLSIGTVAATTKTCTQTHRTLARMS